MNNHILKNVLEHTYYDVRTNHAWHIALGLKDELAKEYFSIPDLGHFLVMNKVMSNRSYTIAQFMAICGKNRKLKHLKCDFDPSEQILTVRSRTFTFSYYAQSWAMNWEVDREVCGIIRLLSPSWLRQPRSANLFHPLRLAELDDELFFRYESRLKLAEWNSSDQSKLDLKLLKEIIPYIKQEAPDYVHALLIAKSKLNIIFEGNDKLRIGLVQNYTPQEMLNLPSYPRDDWQKAIKQTFEQEQEHFRQLLHERHLLYESQIQRLTEGLKMPLPDKETLLPLIRAWYEPFTYTDLLFSEVLDIPFPPHELPYWDARQALLGEDRTVEEVVSMIDSYMPWQYKALGPSLYIDLKNYTVEYNEINPHVVLRLKNHVKQYLPIAPVLEATSDDENVGLDIFMLEHIDDTLSSALQDYQNALSLRQEPQHEQLRSVIRTIVQTCSPLLFYFKQDASEPELYGQISIEIAPTDRIMLRVYTGATYEVEFNLDNFDTEFRVWWYMTMMQETKRLKDHSLHPEQDFKITYDLPF